MKFGRRQGKEEKLEERKLRINMKFSDNRQVKHWCRTVFILVSLKLHFQNSLNCQLQNFEYFSMSQMLFTYPAFILFFYRACDGKHKIKAVNFTVIKNPLGTTSVENVF